MDYLKKKKSSPEVKKRQIKDPASSKQLEMKTPQSTPVKADVATLASNGAKAIVNANTSPVKALSLASDIVRPTESLPSKAKEKVAKVPKEVKEKILDKNRPAIIFIQGMELFDFEESGLAKMAKNIPHSKTYSWDDKSEVLDDIKNRNKSMPVILIGDGLGGDTAVEVSNALNSVDNGFRKVNLLVTIDSSGFNNDIIPQNVKENMNFIVDSNSPFSDGPNIARINKKTKVENFLSDKMFLTEDKKTQLNIFEKINTTLQEAILKRDLSKIPLHSEMISEGISAKAAFD